MVLMRPVRPLRSYCGAVDLAQKYELWTPERLAVLLSPPPWSSPGGELKDLGGSVEIRPLLFVLCLLACSCFLSISGSNAVPFFSVIPELIDIT